MPEKHFRTEKNCLQKLKREISATMKNYENDFSLSEHNKLTLLPKNHFFVKMISYRTRSTHLNYKPT